MLTDPRPRRAGARHPSLAAIALVALLALLLAACSGGAGGGIQTSGAWARTSPMVAGAGAAYVVITNTGSEADALVGAKSTVAASTEVHETYEVEGMPAESMPAGGMESPAASMDMGGSPMLGMRRIDRVEIPAGGTLELKPGSYHIMLIDLVQELKAGESIEIVLVFEKAGDVKVTAEVREG